MRAGSLVYAGMSSGGFLVGPDLLHTADPNDPGVVSNSRGLGIVSFIPLSHANRGREEEHRAIAARFAARYTFVSITDEQAIIVWRRPTRCRGSSLKRSDRCLNQCQ